MFAAESIEEVLHYVFYQIVEMMTQFTTTMNANGASILSYDPVKDILWFFQSLGWGLFLIGAFMAFMEFVVSYREESTNFYGLGMNLLKSFIAVNLFTIAPVLLYNFTVDIHGAVGAALTSGYSPEAPDTMTIIQSFFGNALNTHIKVIVPGGIVVSTIWEFISITKNSSSSIPFDSLILVFVMVYVVVKVFIGNMKRGGIMLIMIGTGSLQMLSIPRGYLDGFTTWCKQVAALCFTVFIQNVLFTLGLMLSADTSSVYLTLGILLSAAEVPRIAQMFGLDTSSRANIGGAVHTVSSAFMIVRTFAR